MITVIAVTGVGAMNKQTQNKNVQGTLAQWDALAESWEADFLATEDF